MGVLEVLRRWFRKGVKTVDGAPAVQGYDLVLKRCAAAGEDASRDLVVVFASGRRFALYNHAFGRDALLVADRDLRYFLRGARHLAAAVGAVVDRGGYERVIFMGSSKGGFGALSIARLCARARPTRTFHVVAFSPQVKLYPRNPALYFNSYEVLIRRAAKQPILMRALRRFGDVSEVGEEPNLVVELVYASGAEVDREEAMRISGPNVHRRTVAGATHGTAFHFMCHGLDGAEIRRRIKRAYRRTGDQDLQQTKPKDVRALVNQIMRSALEEPTLNDLFDEVLARQPAAPMRGGRLRGLLASVEKARAFAIGRSGTASLANAFRSHTR